MSIMENSSFNPFASGGKSSGGGGGTGDGTVTKVDFKVKDNSGLKVEGAPIVDSGTITLNVDNAHSIPTKEQINNWNSKYDTPKDGIPKSDLATAVQDSLGKADTALQEHQSLAGYVPTTRKVAGKELTSDITLSKSDVGLSNVNNTSDANKPISAATQTALNNKVDKVTGKGLSTNDFTNADKAKVDEAITSEDASEFADITAPEFLELENEVSELKEDLSKIMVDKYDTLTLSDESTYYSENYTGGYYDALGNWVAGGSYKNLKLNPVNHSYNIGIEPNAGLYVQICVFDGLISPENFVARYRTSENNLPSFNNMLSVTSGQTVVITRAMGAAVQYCNIKTNWKYGDYEFTDTAKLKISEIYKHESKPLLMYFPVGGNDSSIEAINIYYPNENGYLMYNFVHSVNAEVKSNIWRLSKVFTCDDSLAVINTLTDTAEWECAIKLNGRSDFAGGVIHGDEIMDDVVFIADGKPIDIHNYSSAQYFNKLIVIQKSKLYDPSNEETAFAEHTSEHIFTDGKMVINQTVKFLNSYTLGTSYIGMYPPLKTVTNKYYTDKDLFSKTIDLSNNVTIDGVRETCLYGNNYFSKFIKHKYPQYDSGDYLLMTDNNGRAYNKCYYVVCGNNQTISSGDLWQSSIEYEIIAQID